MYLHLGQERIVRSDEIIGIFDLDGTTVSRHTRFFLEISQKKGEIEAVSNELPKSFVLCTDKKQRKTKIYLSQLSPSTLLKRADIGLGGERRKISEV